MSRISNEQFLQAMKGDPSFKSICDKYNVDSLTTKGFQNISLQIASQDLATMFDMSIRVFLNKAPQGFDQKPPMIFENIVETFDVRNGGIAQRIRNKKRLKPITTKVRNIGNGKWNNPFTHRLVETVEEFYRMQFDYANHLTLGRVDLQKMFNNDTGMFDYMAMLMKDFGDEKQVWEHELVTEIIHKILENSTGTTLAGEQIQEVKPFNEDTNTNKPASLFIQQLQLLYDKMKATTATEIYNSKGFYHRPLPDRMVLFVRADKWNVIKTTLMATTYHTENLGVPFKIVPVVNFGGISYKHEDDDVYPVYSTIEGAEGEVIGFSTDPTDPTATVYSASECTPVDPHKDIYAMLIQKGAIFKLYQNPYERNAIFNPSDLTTNYWEHHDNIGLNYDGSYDVVVFKEEPATP